MANRPVFSTSTNGSEFFKETGVEFKFFNGFSLSQKSKSIHSLHGSAKNEGLKKILEVSTKSDNKIGWQLSAFNLMVDLDDGQTISLECAFQGSKVFENNVQYDDLYLVESIVAKKDSRLKTSGEIVAFSFNGTHWDNEPKTAFYNWLYIYTLYTNYQDIIEELTSFYNFTDIEFNPKKSLNCQARSCAILVSLKRRNLLNEAMKSKENFMEIVYKNQSIKRPTLDLC